MSIFDRMDRALSKIVDRTNAVRFELEPRLATPNGRSVFDTKRSCVTVMGIFDLESAYDAIEVGKRDRTGNDLRTLHSGSRFQLSVDVIQYPEMRQASQGDWIKIYEPEGRSIYNSDMEYYQIVSAQLDGLSRIVLILIKR